MEYNLLQCGTWPYLCQFRGTTWCAENFCNKVQGQTVKSNRFSCPCHVVIQCHKTTESDLNLKYHVES